MKAKCTLFLKLVGSLFALALVLAPSLGTAAVTISQVDVVVGGAHFCDTTVACGSGNQIWNLGGGVTLNAGQTLILTQTGEISVGGKEGNFDTTDRGNQNQLPTCGGSNPCTTQIYINSGSGLTKVYDDTASPGNPLSAFNLEPQPTPSPSFNESATWQSAFIGSTYTLQLGYADNEHSDPCPATGCFPQPVWGPGGATVFLGAGVAPIAGVCGAAGGHPPTDNVGNNVGCYDAGALLITALATGTQGCTPGYWKQTQHFDSWKIYSPSQLVSSVFTVPSQLSGLGSVTLVGALSFQGGPGVNGAAQILLRAAVSALLNSTSVNYPLSTAQVISQVNTALASLNRDTMLALATTLDNDNNLGCPLN